MKKSIMLSFVFSTAAAFASTTNIVRMTPLATFVSGTNAVLVAANRYTDEHGGSSSVTPTQVTNITDHILASSNLVNVATLTSATNAVALDLGNEIATRTTTNDVTAILAASNLCTVAAAQAMTNDATIVRGRYIDSTLGHLTRVAYCYNADLADSANSALKLNEGYWTYGEHPTTLSGYGITNAYTRTESDEKFLDHDWANDETSRFAGEAAYAQAAVSANTSSKIKSNSETWSTEYETYTGAGNADLRLKDSYWGWYAFLSDIPSTNGLASRLTGVTYDFAHGSNFTLRLYVTLTNLIDRLGGAITNAPAFN